MRDGTGAGPDHAFDAAARAAEDKSRLADRGAQAITQRITVNGVVTAPWAIPEFHARQMQLAGKLDMEQIA